METQIIEIDGFKVNHVEVGSGEPVILVHGLGGSWQDWIELIYLISHSFRVCAIDLPGFGMSPPPADGQMEYTLPLIASFVSKLMDAKGYLRAFLIGNSMGGGIVLRCAIDDPERIQGVVLANSIGLGKEISGFNRALAFPGVARLFIPFITRKIVIRMCESLFFNPEVVTPALVDRTWQWIQKAETKKFLIHLYPAALSIWGQKYILLSELGKIRCPTLITWGIYDTVLPVSHAVRGYQEIPSAQLYLLRNCGHVPQIEQAALFNQATLKFLEEALSSGMGSERPK
jgi:pimeloyl-ACP methyl ester carboxylesterase